MPTSTPVDDRPEASSSPQTPTSKPTNETSCDAPASTSQRRLGLGAFALRALWLYVCLYALSYVAFVSTWIAKYLTPFSHDAWNEFLAWLGRVVFGIERDIPSAVTGSGDRTIDFLQVFALAMLSLLGSAIWTAVDQRRRSRRTILGPKVMAYSMVLMRYVLASILLSYGIAKFFYGQFGEPSPGRLIQTYGSSSPMGLLWTFMGSSRPYTLFAGFAEIIPGLLLLWRRTTAVGALGSAATMANVAVLNLCYDVCVKLFSLHLLLLSIVVLLADGRAVRLVGLRSRTHPTGSSPGGPRSGPKHRAVFALKSLTVTWILANTLASAVGFALVYGPDAPKPPLYGTWEIVHLTENGTLRPPEFTDGDRLRYLAVSRWQGYASFLEVDGTARRIALEVDLESRTATTTWREQPDQPATTWTFRLPSWNELEMEGNLDGVDLAFLARRVERDDFLLTTRGFRWISEVPFNR